MLDLNIAEISSSSGVDSDGVVRGGFHETSLVGVFTNTSMSTEVSVLRKDVTDDGIMYTDLTEEAISGVEDAFEPWGSDDSFSATDEVWIAGDVSSAIYVQITTPGEWVGDGIEIWDSPDGETLHQIETVIDTSDGFRNGPGIYKISFTGHEVRSSISPIFGGEKKSYFIIKPKGFVSKTVSPKLSKIWVLRADEDLQFLDITDIVNGYTDSNNFDDAPDEVFFLEGQETHYAFPFLTSGMNIWMYRKGADVRDGKFQYLASDKTWKDLNVTLDESDALKEGPEVLGEDFELFKMRWEIPGDWSSDTHNHYPDEMLITGYWIRYLVTDVSSYEPTDPPLWRSRSRSFGADNSFGIFHSSSKYYTALTFDIGVPSEDDVTIRFSNINTGDYNDVIIPAGITSSGELEDHHLSLNLNINSGESLMISHEGGGTIQDVELRLQ